MAHDFKLWPELTSRQMQFYYFDSPHKQIVEEFRAKVVKVMDGDTIRVKWDERNFDFPVRLALIDAPEMGETGGRESRSWLAEQILGEEVDIIPTKMRVEKWGRLLAHVIHMGLNLSRVSMDIGYSVPFVKRERIWS